MYQNPNEISLHTCWNDCYQKGKKLKKKKKRQEINADKDGENRERWCTVGRNVKQYSDCRKLVSVPQKIKK